MPNRILKESITTSESIDSLSEKAEVFFYRLMVKCDDYGRFDARPSVLRASCYPLRLKTVTETRVAAWLQELVTAGLVWLYEVEGHPYLQVTKWERHQQVRAKYSKFPDPPAPEDNPQDLQAFDFNSNQPPAIVPVFESRESINDIRIRETNTEESAPAQARPPRQPNEIYSLAQVLGEVCGMNFEKNKGRLLREAKVLQESAEHLRQYYGPDSWWYQNDWRGKKGEKPTPATIRETWGRWNDKEYSNGRNRSQGNPAIHGEEMEWKIADPSVVPPEARRRRPTSDG